MFLSIVSVCGRVGDVCVGMSHVCFFVNAILNRLKYHREIFMDARYCQKLRGVRKWLHSDAPQRAAGDLMSFVLVDKCTHLCCMFLCDNLCEAALCVVPVYCPFVSMFRLIDPCLHLRNEKL